MVQYNLEHLTQQENQRVDGPIQDDEALLLYALIRVMRARRVLEIGGLRGYSARNFCEAVGPTGIVYTVDLNPVQSVADNHRPIIKDVTQLSLDDIDGIPIDLLFLDAHAYEPQMHLVSAFEKFELLSSNAVIALHDTNLHPQQNIASAYKVQQGSESGWVHQPVERRIVNDLQQLGYQVLTAHTRLSSHDHTLPYRHGLTFLQKFHPLSV